MELVTYKEITFEGKPYLISRHEYRDRTEYTAWEPAGPDVRVVSFMTKMSHSSMYLDPRTDRKWGAISARIPRDIAQDDRLTLLLLNPKVAGKDFVPRNDGALYHGKIVLRKDKPDDNLPNPTPNNLTMKPHKEPKPADDVKNMLSMVTMEGMQKMARANNVPLKDTDTPGLLKMRLSNALRKILASGGTILS